jgi:hypothetical protein
MNKAAISICMTIGTIIGGLVPIWLGDASLLDGWSILGGLIGGALGIWIGVKIGKALL